MRKMKKTTAYLLSAVMAFSIAFGTPAPSKVYAAKKKLTVNRVYEGAQKIKGKTKKKYTVKVKIGKKTYTKKANKKGNFTIKVPKLAAGKSYTLKSYKGKKYYTKKKVYVIAKKVKVNTFKPSDKTITGYTRPSYKVKLTINGKTYTVKADKTSGKFTVKLSKPAGSGNATVKVYNTKGKSFTSATKTHTHDWKQQYKTVKHEEVGHYETVTVPAWDENTGIFHNVCLDCGRDFDKDYEDAIKNKTYPEVYGDNPPSFDDFLALGGWYRECFYHNYTSKEVIIHHDATTKQQWIVDKAAYTEKVPDGFKCACGVTKK